MAKHLHGSGNIYQRGEVWWIRYSVDGVQHRESSKSTKKADAAALLKVRLAQAGRGESAGNPDISLLLDLVIADYEQSGRKSTKTTRVRVDALRSRWGNVRARDFGPRQIQAHIDERRKAEKATATINRELAVLRRAFALAREKQLLTVTPIIKALPEDNARQGFFTDEEFERLRAKLPAWMVPLATVAFWTGARKGELLGLKWEQFQGNMLRLGKTKNGHPRTIPLAPELKAMLEFCQTTAKSLYVFERDGHRIGEWDIYKPWEAACEAAGLAGRLFHDLRRSGVRNMVRAGVARHVAMAISGHKTDSMFRRYDIVDETDLAAAATKMAQRTREAAPQTAQSKHKAN
jgi:integrase